jgi:hypothetical protein
MATIHRTTMVPGKLDLLSDWLPRQPWYRSTEPQLGRAGGFRLDDPAGEVGIEFIFVTDADGATYHVPLTYRGAPLPEAEPGLIGTSEHGVLGRRWIYDAAHDPVAIAQVLAFLRGEAAAQHQNRSDTPDPSVGRRWEPSGGPESVRPVGLSNGVDGTTVSVEPDHPSPGSAGRLSVHLVRVLREGTPEAAGSRGHVEAD